MSAIFTHPSLVTFGLYKISFEPEKGPGDAWPTVLTVANIIGWIFPLIGLLRLGAGIGRYQNEKKSPQPSEAELLFCKGLIGRGIAEFFCLGPLLFLIDIIFTLGRCISEKEVV